MHTQERGDEPGLDTLRCARHLLDIALTLVPGHQFCAVLLRQSHRPAAVGVQVMLKLYSPALHRPGLAMLSRRLGTRLAVTRG